MDYFCPKFSTEEANYKACLLQQYLKGEQDFLGISL
jgi:hypothetical protein